MPQRPHPADPASECSGSEVLCQYGIYSSVFPVGGMCVGEIRLILNPIFNMDPDAIAVVNGQVVDDDFPISGDVNVLNSVKKSGLIGG